MGRVLVVASRFRNVQDSCQSLGLSLAILVKAYRVHLSKSLAEGFARPQERRLVGLRSKD